MSKAEFVFVPGAWHGPDSFAPTTSALEKLDFVVHGVDIPSVGANPPLKSFAPDVEVVKSAVNKVLASGKDVVMLYHSYGGAVGSEALADYLKEGKKEGWGRIRRLVYIAAFVLPEGGSLMGALGFKPLPWFMISEDGEEIRPNGPAEVFYNDMSPELAQKYIAKLKVHSYLTFSSQLTVAPWKVLPATILCEKDAAIPIFAQEGMIAAAQQAAPKSFDVVERCDASHSPFISQPEWLAEKLAEAASSA